MNIRIFLKFEKNHSKYSRLQMASLLLDDFPILNSIFNLMSNNTLLNGFILLLIKGKIISLFASTVGCPKLIMVDGVENPNFLLSNIDDLSVVNSDENTAPTVTLVCVSPQRACFTSDTRYKGTY